METNIKNLPVAVMDSGIGGISVLRELAQVLPCEDFVFFGDSANAPYGTKETEKIKEIVMDRADYLYSKGIKALVVACNTATSVAIDILRERYKDIPVIGIEPALKPAMMCGENQRVVVMATPMTIREEKFRKLLLEYEKMGTVYPLPCPGLADLIEEGEHEGEKLEKYILELLLPYMDERIDSIVLGCTHYPFSAPVIQKVAGEHVKIIDGSHGTAMQLKRRLEELGLLTDKAAAGKVVFENSINEKIELCRRLFFI